MAGRQRIEVDNEVVCDAAGRTSAPAVWAVGGGRPGKVRAMRAKIATGAPIAEVLA